MKKIFEVKEMIFKNSACMKMICFLLKTKINFSVWFLCILINLNIYFVY